MFFVNPERYIQAFEKAPSPLKEVSASFETAEVIYGLGQKYRAEDKVSIIARLTAYVLVGLMPITQFREKIQTDAGLSLENARAVAGEIRDRVFSRVVEELRMMHGLDRVVGGSVLHREPPVGLSKPTKLAPPRPSVPLGTSTLGASPSSAPPYARGFGQAQRGYIRARQAPQSRPGQTFRQGSGQAPRTIDLRGKT